MEWERAGPQGLRIAGQQHQELRQAELHLYLLQSMWLVPNA
jgi:hypothetical protein